MGSKLATVPNPGHGEVLVDDHAAGVGPWGWLDQAGKARCRSHLPLIARLRLRPERIWSRPLDPAFPSWPWEIRFSV